MPIPTDATIRSKIADVIEVNAPKAIVFSYWVLGFDQLQWPGLLRSPNDLDGTTKRVHGYVIRRIESVGEIRGPSRVKRTYTYEILGLHYYFSGPEGGAGNSEKLVSAEVDLLSDKFDKPGLLVAELARVEPVRWRLLLPNFGGELVHLMLGTLVLQPCEVI
jgi:hypothetical protein